MTERARACVCVCVCVSGWFRCLQGEDLVDGFFYSSSSSSSSSLSLSLSLCLSIDVGAILALVKHSAL